MDDNAWVLETADGGRSGRIAHGAEPWFVCSFAASPETAGEFFGLTVEMDGVFFHDFVWQNGIPHENDIRRLCMTAERMIDAVRSEI